MNPAIVTVNVAAYGFADRISLIRIGILAHRSRARVDQRQLAPRSPLSIAQQSPREFLTEARPSVSVKGYGASTLLRLRAMRKLSQVRESIGQRDHYPYN